MSNQQKDGDAASERIAPPCLGSERSIEKAIVEALKAAGLPLDELLGLALTRIGLVLVHRGGGCRWEAASEACTHINWNDMLLGDWIYGPWFFKEDERR